MSRFQPTVLSITAFYLLFASCNQSSQKVDKQDSIVVTKPTIEQSALATTPTSYNNLAYHIAGMQQDNDNNFKALENSVFWKNYAASITTKFKSLDSNRYSKMRQWRDVELKEINLETEKLFYPFSGPDFLNAYTFFPNAKEYTMLALEPPGNLPTQAELKADTANNYFASVQNGLKAILSFSFFRTEAMETDFANKQLNGAVHLITLFAVKTGNKILDVKPATINSKGDIVISDKNECAIKGVQITFEDSKTHESKIINYFSLDVSDEAVMTNECFKAYAGKLATVTTYLKSASYLMHLGNFSFMRNIILKHSKNILQDDSGIPLFFVKDSVWNKTFYGSYDKPISLFRNKYQERLFKAYNDSLNKPKIRKLPFGIGYDYKQNESNLMLFRKK